MRSDEVSADIKVFISSKGQARHSPGLGRGVVELCERVERLGSLNKAAADMGMAYSKAWRIIKDTEETLDVQLLLRDGAHGSTLTEDGNRLLDAYLAIEEHLSAEADRLFKEMTR